MGVKDTLLQWYLVKIGIVSLRPRTGLCWRCFSGLEAPQPVKLSVLRTVNIIFFNSSMSLLPASLIIRSNGFGHCTGPTRGDLEEGKVRIGKYP